MKNFRLFLAVVALFGFALALNSCAGKGQEKKAGEKAKTEQPTKMKIKTKQGKEYTSAYICPMHCKGSGSDKPGSCPVCGMDYVANKDAKKSDDGHEGHNH